MPFDWANYLILAAELRERDGEAELRTAISRVYYSVFHQARDYLEKELRFETSRYDSVHKRLWDEFKKHGRQFGGVGINGSRLNDARRIADYEDETGKPYKTKFCGWYDPDAGKLALCDHHNSAD